MVMSRPCNGLQSASCGERAQFISETAVTWKNAARDVGALLALYNDHRGVGPLGQQFEPVERTRIGNMLPAPLLLSGLAVFTPCPRPELLVAPFAGLKALVLLAFGVGGRNPTPSTGFCRLLGRRLVFWRR
jgi:hypothetical protein